MTHPFSRKSASFGGSRQISVSKPSTSKSQVSKFLTAFKPTTKKRASKASQFSSSKSKKSALITAKQPKKSLVSPFLTNFKATNKFAKSRGKRPTSVFITASKKLSKNTPEISSFIASTSSPTFKKRKVGKSKVFSSARLSAKPQPTTGITTKKTSGKSDQKDLLSILTSLAPSAPTPLPKNSVLFPSTPDSTSGDDTNILDSIADFFNNFFGGGGSSSQERTSDAGTITSINFSPVTLPSQDGEIVQDESGLFDVEPRESFGLGLGGVSDDREDKDGILNSIVNDPIKLGLAIIAIIGGIVGFTGGK